MKRIIAIALCTILVVCAVTLVASAEEMLPEADPETPAVEEPEEPSEEEPTVTESIVDYVKSHIEEISVIATLILTAFYNVRKHGVLTQSIGALNNNAISVAENSNDTIQTALAEIGRVGTTVVGYSVKIEELLEAFRSSVEGKEKLEGLLEKTESFLEVAKMANVELANEVAELLVLANIPNSKKDELYARHLAAVNAIAEHTEVTHNDGEEA